MTDLMTQVDRLNKLSILLLKMTKNFYNDNFWEISEEFDNEVAMNRLEDEMELTYEQENLLTEGPRERRREREDDFDSTNSTHPDDKGGTSQ